MTQHTYTAEFASGCRAELTISLASMQCAWTPEFPRSLRGERRRQFLAAYRAWRNECIADYARRTGLRFAVIDV